MLCYKFLGILYVFDGLKTPNKYDFESMSDIYVWFQSVNHTGFYYPEGSSVIIFSDWYPARFIDVSTSWIDLYVIDDHLSALSEFFD